jgi:nicotinate dehydrogenase subunit B
VSLAANPLLSSWLEFTDDERVILKIGKVELGQGIVTALAQIAAEELTVDWRRMRPLAAATGDSPDEGMTVGSRSVMDSGAAVRQVCAQVRHALLDEAARRSGLPREELTVADGVACDSGGRPHASYWRDGAKLLAASATEQAAPKPYAEHAVVGRPLARLDLEDKLVGRPRFVQDLGLPGTLFARVVRPPAPGDRLESVDESAAGCDVVRRGSFLAVVAEREEDAVRAAETLRRTSVWRHEERPLPDMKDLPAHLRRQHTDDVPIATPSESRPVHRTHTWEYAKPYVAHASIAPASATARWAGGRLEVWTSSQGVYPLRRQLAAACGIDADAITLRHVENAGCYGHTGADDAAYDAALLARELPGRPVQVGWSRDDEFAWEPYSPAAVVEVSVGVDRDGDIARWRQRTWSGGHNGRAGYAGQPGLLGWWHAEEADVPPAEDYPLAFGGGIGRNGVPGYDIADLEVMASRTLSMPLRTSSLRGLGATANVFAIESAMSELAELAEADPVEYRLRHLKDERGRAVLRAAARIAGWDERDSAGWGVAYARYKNVAGYCAAVAHVEAVSEVKVRHLYLAVDAGQVINPDGLRNQVEGGAIQAASWTLLEQVAFDHENVTSRDWDTYPILRFSDVPAVDIELISRPGEPPLGVGEVAGGPVTAAIANALADAIGVRVRSLPLTPENVTAAIEQAPIR